MVITFPIFICVKGIGDKKDSIYCDKCNFWVHIKRNNLIINIINSSNMKNENKLAFCNLVSKPPLSLS